MAVIPVDIAGRPYEVRVGAGLLAELVPHCRGRLRKRGVPIVTDSNVHAAWGDVIEKSLRDNGHEPHWRILPPGEQTKSWDELAATVNWLLALEVERGDHIIALGGGVIGDLTGFCASVLKRGCKFIQVPTTLLAQVDSSVGGKTAINTPAGKNLVGAFHQPSLVLADLSALETLPERELLAGYAEVVKYGLIDDADFFAWCERNGSALIAGDSALREYAVSHSVAAKARIVAEDEFETTGKRALLNLGHTFGHALEAETGFSNRLLHGEAVALGMVLAVRYSARKRPIRNRLGGGCIFSVKGENHASQVQSPTESRGSSPVRQARRNEEERSSGRRARHVRFHVRAAAQGLRRKRPQGQTRAR